jgi:hypothetical protein
VLALAEFAACFLVADGLDGAAVFEWRQAPRDAPPEDKGNLLPGVALVVPPHARHDHVHRPSPILPPILLRGVVPTTVDPLDHQPLLFGCLATKHGSCAVRVVVGMFHYGPVLLLGAEGGAAAGDKIGASVLVVMVKRHHHVAPKEEDVVFAFLQPVAVLREVVAERDVPPVGAEEVAGGVPDGPISHDPHGSILDEDLGDPKGAVAAEEQPWGVVAGVAGEVEPRPVAAGVPEAERVMALSRCRMWCCRDALSLVRRRLLQDLRAATPSALAPPQLLKVAQMQRLAASWVDDVYVCCPSPPSYCRKMMNCFVQLPKQYVAAAGVVSMFLFLACPLIL